MFFSISAVIASNDKIVTVQTVTNFLEWVQYYISYVISMLLHHCAHHYYAPSALYYVLYKGNARLRTKELRYMHVHTLSGFSLGLFWVVQHNLHCLVHQLDHNGMQLCTTWVQGKTTNGYGLICCYAQTKDVLLWLCK